MFKIIFDVIFKGALILLGLQFAMIFAGDYLGFVIYHLIVGIFFVCSSVFHLETIIMIELAFFLFILRWIFKATKKILGF